MLCRKNQVATAGGVGTLKHDPKYKSYLGTLTLNCWRHIATRPIVRPILPNG